MTIDEDHLLRPASRIETPMSDSPIRHVPTVPYDPAIPRYNAFGGYFEPFEVTGWVDESMSWKNTCYIGDWSPMSKLRLTGPDAERFFSETTVNSYAAFEVGRAKHAVFCNANGNIMGEGVLVREAPDSIYLTSGFAVPWAQYLLDRGDYDVRAEDITTQMTLQQIQGPASLDLLEELTGESLRDLRFMRVQRAYIDGMPVDILRQGMSGEIGFELHGRWDEGEAVYRRALEVGAKYGIRRLGGRTKMVNHIEACFPTPTVDFVPAWFDRGVEDFLAWVQDRSWRPVEVFRKHSGSVVTDERATELYRTPYDLGWGRNVKFDHAFLGDAALRRLADHPPRTIRTLVWDHRDVLDVLGSLFDKEGTPYTPFEFPRGYLGDVAADRVLVDGEDVGQATSRCYSYFFREMISLAVLDTAHAELGAAVEVLWGAPDGPQKRIRATVAPAPYKTDRRRKVFGNPSHDSTATEQPKSAPPTADYDHLDRSLTKDRVWAAYTEMRERCPVVHVPHHGGHLQVVGYEEVRDAALRATDFSSADGAFIPPVGAPRLPPLDFDGEEHATWRALMRHPLTPAAVKALHAEITEVIDTHVDAFAKAGEAELFTALAEPVPVHVVGRIVGLSAPECVELRQVAIVMFQAIGTPEFEARKNDLEAFIVDQLARRRTGPQGDYLSMLATGRVEGHEISDADAVAMLMTLLVAGHHSTAAAMAGLLHHVLSIPEAREAALAGGARLTALVEESLRITTPLHLFARTATTDTAIGGFDVPAGTRLFLNLAAANHDPARFPEPESLRLDRKPNPHLAFGFGPHLCLGAPLARAELREVVSILLARLPDVRLAGEIRYSGLQGGKLLEIEHLPVVFTPPE